MSENRESFFTRHPKILTGLFVLAVLGFFVYNTSLVYVKPHEFGIKKVNIGLNRGLQEKVYETGLHFVLPFGFQEMYTLPKNLQVLELTDNNVERARARVFQKAAHIQTSDGFFVQVDLSIIYHIEDPYKVVKDIGAGKLFITNVMIPKTEPILKETLGELTTEDFYNSDLRVAAMKKAQVLLDSEVKAKGLRVDHVLIRYFRYSSEIQKNIEDKKLSDQLAFKNQAEARAAAELAKLKKVEQEGKAAVQVMLEKARAYVVKKDAEKDLYTRSQKAKADLMVELAEANRVNMRNEALKSAGSDKRVGLEMAKVLDGLDFVMLPSNGKEGLNPLDLNGLLDLFGVDQRAKK